MGGGPLTPKDEGAAPVLQRETANDREGPWERSLNWGIR